MKNKTLLTHKTFAFAYLLLAVVFVGCINNGPRYGYIVAKEYTPSHMSNGSATTVSYAAVFMPAPVPHTTTPYRIAATYIWFVANKFTIIQMEVDSIKFHSKKCGDKVMFDNNYR